VEKANKGIRNRKATGDDDVPGDVLKLLGEGSLKIPTKLINNLYETGEWPRTSQVTMIALKKKTSYKMQLPLHNQPYCTQSKDNCKNT
jgi:hypothetical protein